MAKKTDEDPFGPWLNGFGYDQAFNGDTWKLVRKQDFELSASTIAGKLRDEYERRFGSLEVKVDGDTVWVRRLSTSAGH